MVKFKRQFQNRGTILILTLWVLSFLTILAVHLGYHIRQKVALLDRLESRSQLQHSAQAGIKKSIAMLKKFVGKDNRIAAVDKQSFFNNPEAFSKIPVGQNIVEVGYQTRLELKSPLTQRFGLNDETSKLNINTATVEEMRILLNQALSVDEDTALDIALAIFDWRQEAKSELVGFYSEDYYEELRYPYKPKDAPFENLNELLLVKGISAPLYERLINFVTIYTDGGININTASVPVLLAIGIYPDLVDKIIIFRRGSDQEEATADDELFLKQQSIITQLEKVFPLEQFEAQQLDDMSNSGRLITMSGLYSIKSTAFSSRNNEKKVINCVFDFQNGKIKYWYEE